MKTVLILFLLCQVTSIAAELGEMSVTEVPEAEMGNYIVRNANEAILVVHTSIIPLSFDNYMGIIKVENPEQGGYVLHLHPGTNIIQFKNEEYQPTKLRLNIDINKFKEVHVSKLVGSGEDRGSVKIETDQIGAKVFIDLKYAGIDMGEGLEVGNISIGGHIVKAEYQGFSLNSAESTIVVEHNKTTQINLTLNAKSGDLFITSTPKGARIHLDKKITDKKTPHIIEGISAGLHEVILKLDNYYDYKKIISIESGKTLSLVGEFTKKDVDYVVQDISADSNGVYTALLNGNIFNAYQYHTYQGDKFNIFVSESNGHSLDSTEVIYTAYSGHMGKVGIVQFTNQGYEMAFWMYRDYGTGGGVNSLFLFDPILNTTYNLNMYFTTSHITPYPDSEDFHPPIAEIPARIMEFFHSIKYSCGFPDDVTPDNPRYMFYYWKIDNDNIYNRIFIRKYPGKSPGWGSVTDTVLHDNIIYTSHFKAGVIAYDTQLDSSWAIYHPNDKYDWIGRLEVESPYLVLYTRYNAPNLNFHIDSLHFVNLREVEEISTNMDKLEQQQINKESGNQETDKSVKQDYDRTIKAVSWGKSLWLKILNLIGEPIGMMVLFLIILVIVVYLSENYRR